MSQRITIEIKNKIATCLTELPVVCGNADYEVEFAFDEEWNEHEIKTATFVVNGELELKVFSGNVCEMPVLQNTLIARIGVFAGTIDDGTLSTSTPAIVHCKPSATCGNATPAPPKDDVYNQIIKRINEIEFTAAPQSDYEQADETAKDYIKNRPFYDYHQILASWDKDTKLDEFTFTAGYSESTWVFTLGKYRKVSDTVITKEDFLSSVEIKDGNEYEISSYHMYDRQNYYGYYKDLKGGTSTNDTHYYLPKLLVVLEDNTDVSDWIDDVEFVGADDVEFFTRIETPLSKGIYVLLGAFFDEHIFSIEKPFFKRLDEKYLPETAAKKEYVKESVAEEFANEKIKIEEYIDEKIAKSLEIPKASTPLCIWDGVSEGRDTFEAVIGGQSMTFVKMNDTIFTFEEAEKNVSKIIMSDFEGNTEETPAGRIDVFNDLDYTTQSQSLIFIMFVGMGYICVLDAETASTELNTTIPSNGLYVMDLQKTYGAPYYFSSLEFFTDAFKITEEGEVLVKGQRVATEEDLKELGQVDLEDYYNKEQIDDLVGDINSVLENILGV